MACICFREKRFKPESEALIGRCNEVVGRYMKQSLILTARQLFINLFRRT